MQDITGFTDFSFKELCTVRDAIKTIVREMPLAPVIKVDEVLQEVEREMLFRAEKQHPYEKRSTDEQIQEPEGRQEQEKE